ncbi:MAG: hypothetical protein OEY77_03630 [Nitrospira sp.]|nr:hypothetical protein [Nitrospira sp.]
MAVWSPARVPIIRIALSLVVLFALALESALLHAADKTAATIFVKDALTLPNQPATIEAKLIGKGLLASTGLGGEPLELVVDGDVVATAMTGGDGRAFLTYTPKAQGIKPVHVRVGKSPRVNPIEGQANLVVWEKRQPILMIELSSLMDIPPPSRVPAIGLRTESERKPMSEAADELEKLTRFYYGVIYVVPLPSGGDGFRVSTEVGEWLKLHKFPAGYVLPLSADMKGLGEKIDEFQEAGWKTVKIGIGRSKAFAEAFLQRRLDAIMVPEPVKGDVPRKAQVAKDWKDVRRKL